MESYFEPLCHNHLDESTIACCLSKIIFSMELVETKKDCPKEGLHAKLKFEYTMTKTACITQPLWGTKRVCLLDSRFGYMSTLLELKKMGGLSVTVFKQKGVGDPKGSDAWNVLCNMEGKEVGYQGVANAQIHIILEQICGLQAWLTPSIPQLW